MAMHRLTSITIGVPDVAAAAAYYRDFGLDPLPDPDQASRAFATRDGGEQLRLAHSPHRRLTTLGLGVHHEEDLQRLEASLTRLDLPTQREPGRLRVVDPASRLEVIVEIAPELKQPASAVNPTNGPGRLERPNGRAAVLTRQDPVRPSKLGHVVIGSVDKEATQRFFTNGLGFKTSDDVKGIAAFMRCTPDHHNVLVQQAPTNFLHHTAWEVDDVDEVARGATAMLEQDPTRHIWGLGRHYLGSNFFWYLRDPAGNYTEYYSDLDCVIDDALWKPEVVAEAPLHRWGPPPPPSFITPEDLAALMAGAHSG